MKTIKIKADGQIIETTEEVLKRMDFFNVMLERWSNNLIQEKEYGKAKAKAKEKTKTIKVDDAIEIMQILVNLARYGDWKIPEQLQDIVKQRAEYYGLKLESPGIVYSKKLIVNAKTFNNNDKQNLEVHGIITKFVLWFGNENSKANSLVIENNKKEIIFQLSNNTCFLIEFEKGTCKNTYYLNKTVLNFLQNFDHLFISGQCDLVQNTEACFYLLLET